MEKNDHNPILEVRIADTTASLAQGLMWVKDLPPNAGMLFKFDQPTQPRFWGKNTYIPLDVAFVSSGLIVDIKKIAPLSLRMVGTDYYCDMAIEANAGFFHNHSIKTGNRIKINQNNNRHEIIFVTNTNVKNI